MRLNQFIFVDDTTLGVVAVASIMALDAIQGQLLLGGWLAPILFGSSNPSSLLVGTTQLLLLFGLALLLDKFQSRRAIRRLKPIALEDVDRPLGVEAHRVMSLYPGNQPIFKVTPNIADCNAVCLPVGRKVWVVLGGGLRVIFRKSPATAASIIGHECAHVVRQDVRVIVFVWHLFQSYVILSALKFVLSQFSFWYLFVQNIPGYRSDGMTLEGMLVANAFVIPRNGIYPFIQIILIGVFLNVFVRWREFMADETCAQKGFRSSLAALLALPRPIERFRLTNPFTAFHPSAAERGERVRSPASWARISYLFCMASSALAEEISEKTTEAHQLNLPDVHQTGALFPPNEQGTALFAPAGGQSPLLLLAQFLLFILILFFIGNHIYRATSVQYALGAPLRTRLADGCRAWLAVWFGYILGTFLNNDALNYWLNAATIGGAAAHTQETLGLVISGICGFGVLALPWILAVVLLVPLAAKRYRRQRAVRVVYFAVAAILLENFLTLLVAASSGLAAIIVPLHALDGIAIFEPALRSPVDSIFFRSSLQNAAFCLVFSLALIASSELKKRGPSPARADRYAVVRAERITVA